MASVSSLIASTPQLLTASKLQHRPKSTRRQIRRDPRITTFVSQFIITGNGTKSAIAAGCSQRSAGTQANRWLKRADVQADLAALLQHKADSVGLSATYVLEKLKSIAEQKDTRPADKIAALAYIGKHLNMFTDRKEVDTKIMITVERIGT